MSRATYDLRLPARPFFFTVDQIATLTGLTMTQVRASMFRSGESIGIPPRDEMLAVNLAPCGDADEWRVEEKELLRWLRQRGYTILTRW